jgi:hypothetical protein
MNGFILACLIDEIKNFKECSYFVQINRLEAEPNFIRIII